MRVLLASLAALSLSASAQPSPQQGMLPPAQAPVPPPRAPTAARPLESARVVEREIAQAAGAGNAALLEGRYGQARASYEEAQVLAPELAELEYNRGVSLLLEGEFEGAGLALEQGLSLSHTRDPEAPEGRRGADPALASDAQFNLGHVAFGQQDLAAAARRFATALSAQPGSEDARRNLELVLRALQQQEQQEQQEGDDQQQDDQQQQDQEQDPSEEQEQQDQGEGENEQQQDQEQQDEEQQDQPQEGEDEQPPQEKPGQMSREQVEQLLDALAEEEREALRQQQQAQKKEALPAPGGKDW